MEEKKDTSESLESELNTCLNSMQTKFIQLEYLKNDIFDYYLSDEKDEISLEKKMKEFLKIFNKAEPERKRFISLCSIVINRQSDEIRGQKST